MERDELRSRIKNRHLLKKMAALTGVAPVSLGLKDRDPELLDDKADGVQMSGTSGVSSGSPRCRNTHKKERTAGIAV
jgi:hypothetical protein